MPATASSAREATIAAEDQTGMGLRISRSIIESHGDRLWAADKLPAALRFSSHDVARAGVSPMATDGMRMKKASTTTVRRIRQLQGQQLTIGLVWVIARASTVFSTDRAKTFGKMPRSRIALGTGTHSAWVSRLLSELGHEAIVAHARNVRLIGEGRTLTSILSDSSGSRNDFCMLSRYR
jgi:hypothetical protein